MQKLVFIPLTHTLANFAGSVTEFASDRVARKGPKNIDEFVLATLQAMHFRKSISRWVPGGFRGRGWKTGLSSSQ